MCSMSEARQKECPPTRTLLRRGDDAIPRLLDERNHLSAADSRRDTKNSQRTQLELYAPRQKGSLQ